MAWPDFITNCLSVVSQTITLKAIHHKSTQAYSIPPHISSLDFNNITQRDLAPYDGLWQPWPGADLSIWTRCLYVCSFVSFEACNVQLRDWCVCLSHLSQRAKWGQGLVDKEVKSPKLTAEKIFTSFDYLSISLVWETFTMAPFASLDVVLQRWPKVSSRQEGKK